MNDALQKAQAYLDMLSGESMELAWGRRTDQDRYRIMLAALLFGDEFERRTRDGLPADEPGERRLLMDIMSAVVERFADLEKLDREEAAAFLGDLTNRDHILELDEVIETFEQEGGQRSLDEVLREVVERRKERRAWARHWSSG
ncbi:MAG: hypothetical protein IRY88_17735 [Rubrobacteraceae bacterium]|uniref:hypothetical protein n=1 Tax=Rubrobacter naiadicus TaxID=1392641 RepID=UPI00235E75B2|nr:hypothetical protein [Rubrobacter naiadicus]MBX6765486.1 hypothetical protein [Rubrobacteraceae bacterium]